MEIIEIRALLQRLGVPADYRSFFYTVYAVYLGMRQPERLLLVTKWIYPDVAKYFGTSWGAVERGIRFVIEIAWENNPELLSQMAQRPLCRRPPASRFLAMMCAYLPPDMAA